MTTSLTKKAKWAVGSFDLKRFCKCFNEYHWDEQNQIAFFKKGINVLFLLFDLYE